MTPELCHWIVIGVKAALIYFIGLPLVVVGFILLAAVLRRWAYR